MTVLFSLGICSWASDTTAGATWETPSSCLATKETSARPEETRSRARSALAFRGQGVCGRLLEENCRVCFALRRRMPCALPVCTGQRRRSVQATGLPPCGPRALAAYPHSGPGLDLGAVSRQHSDSRVPGLSPELQPDRLTAGPVVLRGAWIPAGTPRQDIPDPTPLLLRLLPFAELTATNEKRGRPCRTPAPA